VDDELLALECVDILMRLSWLNSDGMAVEFWLIELEFGYARLAALAAETDVAVAVTVVVFVAAFWRLCSEIEATVCVLNVTSYINENILRK
jgi:uncharacterized membrane protein